MPTTWKQTLLCSSCKLHKLPKQQLFDFKTLDFFKFINKGKNVMIGGKKNRWRKFYPIGESSPDYGLILIIKQRQLSLCQPASTAGCRLQEAADFPSVGKKATFTHC